MKPPELLMADTEVSGMTIWAGWNAARGWPFAVAEVKLAVPKLVSGRTPPKVGYFPRDRRLA